MSRRIDIQDNSDTPINPDTRPASPPADGSEERMPAAIRLGTNGTALKVYGSDDGTMPPDRPMEAPARAVATHYVHQHLNGAWGTVIGREWAEKARPTCGGLCAAAACRFSGGFCLVAVDRYVPAELCRDFASQGGDVGPGTG